MSARASRDIMERFWVKVQKTDTCWLWNGGVREGYGIFAHDGKKTPAHRFLYEHINGPVSSTLDICHRCDVRACVNPDHLFVGTRSDNMKDASKKGRLTMPGVGLPFCRNGHAKTEENIYRPPKHPTYRVCRICARGRERAEREAVRDATSIRAATLEECADMIVAHLGYDSAAVTLAARIRALAATPPTEERA